MYQQLLLTLHAKQFASKASFLHSQSNDPNLSHYLSLFISPLITWTIEVVSWVLNCSVISISLLKKKIQLFSLEHEAIYDPVPSVFSATSSSASSPLSHTTLSHTHLPSVLWVHQIHYWPWASNQLLFCLQHSPSSPLHGWFLSVIEVLAWPSMTAQSKGHFGFAWSLCLFQMHHSLSPEIFWSCWTFSFSHKNVRLMKAKILSWSLAISSKTNIMTHSGY